MFVAILLSISIACSSLVWPSWAGSESTTADTDLVSLRIQLERYDQLGHISCTKRILERYSSLEARAVVELEDLPVGNGQQLESARTIYHHESASGLWLRTVSDSDECSLSSKQNFHLDLYGGPAQLPLELETSGPGTGEHVIGLANLLAGIMRICSPQLVAAPSTQRLVRGHQAVEYNCQMNAGTQVEMLYASEGGRDTSLHWPMWLNLTLPEGTSFVMNIYLSSSPVGATPMGEPATTSFMFPLGCGSVLEAARGANGLAGGAGLLAAMESLRGLSFKARFLVGPSSLGEPSTSGRAQEVENLFVAYNLRSGLLRRESLLLDHSMVAHERAKSITIYDTKRGFKHHFVSTFATKARDYNYSLSNIADEGSKTTECLTMEMEVAQPLKFIDFRRLQFMGRARLDGVGVRVYQEHDLERLPFWLEPTAESASEESQTGSERPVKHVTLVYHFVDEGRGDRLGQLVRVQVLVRDKLRRLVVANKQVDIFNFRWNTLEDSPTGVRAAHLFALAVNCPVASFERSLWLDMYLEPRDGKLDQSLRDKQWSSNEMLSEAIGQHFDLPQTHLDHLITEIDQPNNLYVEFRINYITLRRAKCRRLGRGQFLSQSRLMRSTSSSFEDCLWFANYCSRQFLSGAEVVFGYDATGSQCLVDRLYKWRQLQSHEASLQSEDRLKSLNYFPYEFGQHILHTIDYHSVAPVGPTRPIKSLDHIGRQLTLTTQQAKDINLVISNIKISRVNKRLGGPTTTTTTTAADTTTGHLRYLGWRQVEGDDNVVRKISSLKWVSYLQDPRTVGALSETLCKSYCLTDLDCKSYSFCERSRSRPAECLVAKLDILEPELAQQLGSLLLTSGTWRENKVRQISVDQKPERANEISVVISKRCSIYSKSYADLFVRGSQMKLDLSRQLDVVEVESEDKCAERCYAKNLDYMRGIVRHKLELDKIQRDIMAMLDDNQMISESMMDKLDSAADWQHRHLKHLCLHFLYADQNNSSANNSCILSSADKSHTVDLVKPKVAPKMTMINMHKMIFSNLYERMPGLRLVKSVETPQTRGKQLEDPILNHYANWLEFRKAGNNSQILLASDDVENCARACTLQTHGPRPSCSSFDFVYETPTDGTPRKYCLLNSQSLHDLGRKGLMARQVVYMSDFSNVQFWHFEPRELLLTSSSARDGAGNQDDEEDDCELYNLLSGMDVKISKSTGNHRAFKSISLTLTLLGVASGLIIGMGLANYWTTHKAHMDEMTFKNRVIRTVHRLSGVSMSQMFQDQEVRM